MRIIGIDVPGFGVPTHAEAKDVLAGAMLKYARTEASQGPVQAPRGGRSAKPTVALIGEVFPADPVGIGMMLEPLGLAAGPVVPTREWRELYAALDCAVAAAIHPFYTAAIREFERRGPRQSSARRRWDTTAPPLGSRPSARPADVARGQGRRRARTAFCRPSRRRSPSRRSAAASPCRATRVRSCWSRDC